jgi:hypothetical protein
MADQDDLLKKLLAAIERGAAKSDSGKNSTVEKGLGINALAAQFAKLKSDSVFLGNSFKDQVKVHVQLKAQEQAKLKLLEKELAILEKATDQWSKTQLAEKQKEKATLASVDSVGIFNKAVMYGGAALGGFSKGLLNLSGSALTKFSSGLSGIQSGAGAIQSGTGLLTSAIDLASEAGSAAGKGLQGVGTIAMAGGPKLKALGAAASVAGMMLDTLSSGAGKAAKFAVEFLGKQLEQVREGFQSMSASGAVFSNGMTGMIDAAHGAGLTIQQFGKVVKENAKDLAASGLGMTGATEKLGKVTTQINNSGIGERLQKLGFTFEEQAGLVADVMGQMNKYGTGRGMSDAKLAQETEKYAKDLRLISGITGEDAKAKIAQAREAANNLAFQNKLAEMAPEQARAMQDAMANMTKQQQKDFMEMQVFGTVVNKTGAVMMASSNGYSSMMQELTTATNPEDVIKIKAKYKDEIQRDRKNSEGIGMAAAAGVGGVGDIAAAFNETLTDIAKYTPEAFEKLKTSVENAASTQDKLTGEYIAMERAYQNQRVELETFAISHMNTYITGVKTVNKLMTAAIEEMKKIPGPLGFIQDNWMKILEGAVGIIGAIGATAGILASLKQNRQLNDQAKANTTPPPAPTAPGAPGGSGPKGGGPAGGNSKSRRKANRQNKGRSGAAGAISGVLGGGAPDGSASNPYHVIMAGGGPGISDLLDGGKNKGTPTKTPSKLGTIAKVGGRALGAAGSVVAVGMMASELSDISKKLEKGEITKEEASKQKGGAIGEAGGGVAGGLAGAAMGAAVGSVVPVVGTIIGGLIGGALGAWGGGAAGRAGGEAVGTSVSTGGATPTTQAATVAQLSEAQKLSSTQYAETLKAMDLTQPDLLINKSVAEQLKLAKAGNTMFTEQNKLLEKMAKSLEDQSDYLKNIRGNTA